ncbi:unnamed protein product [Mytilus coruscus]|uniref:CCHC-type domain-containing protein n=1 Tax=Mytilus coruscus TaxID=42192 RepID=A0A6J8AL48_MYTCO|nr:unnamed protein product [Mytilus coruscus]
MDLLKIIKRYRSDKDPKLQEFDGKCLSTFSREDLLQVATNIKLHLNDILVLLDIDDSRENLCRVVSFALEQKDELREDTVIQEPPKKKAKTSENKSSGAFMLNVNIVQAFMLNVNIVQAFMLNVNIVQLFMLNVNMVIERENSGFYAERILFVLFMPNVKLNAFYAEREYCSCFYAERGNYSSFYAEREYCSGFYAEREYCSGFYAEREYGSGFYAERENGSGFYAEREIGFYAERGKAFYDEREYCSCFYAERGKIQAFMLNVNIVQIKTLEDKIADLEKRLEKKQADDELSEFERAKRDVKDEAAKGKVDIDVLHERLILLDNLARKQNHDLKDKINLILSRFHIHKNRPNFAAALVLKLVCNKEEEAVLDKEQKLLKTFGLNDVHSDNYNMQSHNFNLHGPGFMGGSFGQTQGHTYGMPPRFSGSPRRGRPRGNNHNLCFKCNKPGHFVRDCTATLDKFRLKPWEFDINLGTDPTSVTVRQPTFVNFENKIIDNDREVNSAEEVYSKATDGVSPDIRNVKFFNPKTFVAGQIHTRLHQWQKILPCSHSSDEILDWLVHGVNINKYIVHFKGDFWGHFYDDKFPPCRIFNNSNKCKTFSSFITETVMERLKNGSIECIGKVGLVKPSHIVAPLTVEPTKPRLCINLMYLNNWIKDIPFSLDTLKNVPRSVRENAYFTTIDDKSGLDNVIRGFPKASGFPMGWLLFYLQNVTVLFQTI